MIPDRARLIVLIVSYGNPDDVNRCLRSLGASSCKDFEVFICENAGPEAYGKLLSVVAGAGGTLEQTLDSADALDCPSKRITTVTKCRFRNQTNTVHIGLATENFGYGGGLNVWLERLLASSGWDAVLVLNPDTEVDENCLSELMFTAREGYGMVGGTLVFDEAPNKIISYGLKWSPITGRVIAIGRDAPAGSSPSAKTLLSIDAISGACVLVTRAFVEDVGLMAEDYFLYMEDLDWGRRRGRHRIGFADKAVVRHIGGTTIGSAVDLGQRSPLSIYLSARNSILYARRFAGWRWPLHLAVGIAFAVRYLFKGFPIAAKTTLAGLIDGIKGKSGRPDLSPGV